MWRGICSIKERQWERLCSMDEDDIKDLIEQYGFDNILLFFNMTEVDVLVALDDSGYIRLSEMENEDG